MSSFNFRAGGCSWCHPGGGPLEYDREGYRFDGAINGGLSGKNAGANPLRGGDSTLNTADPDPFNSTDVRTGDYWVFKPSDPGANPIGLVPKAGADGKGVGEADCLMCHLDTATSQEYNNQDRDFCQTVPGVGSAFASKVGPTFGLTLTSAVTATTSGAGANPDCTTFTYNGSCYTDLNFPLTDIDHAVACSDNTPCGPIAGTCQLTVGFPPTSSGTSCTSDLDCVGTEAGGADGTCVLPHCRVEVPSTWINTSPNKESCGNCHFPDFDKNKGIGPASAPLDFTTFQKLYAPGSFTDSDTGAPNVASYNVAKGRAEFGKRGSSINDPGNPDVHMDAGMECVDCHYMLSGVFDAVLDGNNNVMQAQVDVKAIDHQFAKGNNRPDGKNMDQLDNTVTCESCHIDGTHPALVANGGTWTAPVPTHTEFAGVGQKHFQVIDCRSCHIPQTNFVKTQVNADYSSTQYPEVGIGRGQFASGGRLGMKPSYMWRDRGHRGTEFKITPIMLGSAAVWKNLADGLPYSKRFAVAAAKQLRTQMGGGGAWTINSPQGGDVALIINTTTEIDTMVDVLQGTVGTLGAPFQLAEPALNLFVNTFTYSHNVGASANALGYTDTLEPAMTGCLDCHNSTNSPMFDNGPIAAAGPWAGKNVPEGGKGVVFFQPNEGNGLEMTCDGNDCNTGTARVTGSIGLVDRGGNSCNYSLTAGVAAGDPINNVLPQFDALCWQNENPTWVAILQDFQTLMSYFTTPGEVLDAQFSYAADSTASGQVNFDALAATCSPGPDLVRNCSYAWDFGDLVGTATGLFTNYTYTDIPTCEDLIADPLNTVDTCVGGPNAGGACSIATVGSDCGYDVTMTITDDDTGQTSSKVHSVLPIERFGPLRTDATSVVQSNTDALDPVYTTVDMSFITTNQPQKIYVFWGDGSRSMESGAASTPVDACDGGANDFGACTPATSDADCGVGVSCVSMWSTTIAQKQYIDAITDDCYTPEGNYQIRWYVFDDTNQRNMDGFGISVVGDGPVVCP